MTTATVGLERLRKQIEAALLYSGGTHTFEDVVEAIETKRMQAWEGEESVIVTELITNPNGRRDVHFFLAAGNEAELKTLHHVILEWALTEGCSHATCVGRFGWARSWLTRDLGWQPTLLVFERGIDGEKPVNDQ